MKPPDEIRFLRVGKCAAADQMVIGAEKELVGGVSHIIILPSRKFRQENITREADIIGAYATISYPQGISPGRMPGYY